LAGVSSPAGLATHFLSCAESSLCEQIARDWNTKDKASDYAGFVTAFDVDADYLAQFEEHIVGGSQHRELWIPSEELDTFNQHIKGNIRLVARFYGEQYSG